MKRCVIFKPNTNYLLGVCAFYKNALESCGFLPTFIDTQNDPFKTEKTISKVNDCKFILSFESDGINLSIDGESIYDRLNRTLICLCAKELPEFQFKTLRIILGLRDMYPMSMSSFFAPSPGLYLNRDAAKSIDVLFYYDLMPPNDFREQWLSNWAMADVCDNMLDILLSDETIVSSQAFDSVMEANGIYLENFADIRPNTDFKRLCVRLTERYMENHRRETLLRELERSGIKVTICSNLGFTEYLKILSESKVVISANAAHRYSLPERMACAMASNAVAAGDTNEFTAKIFAPDEYIRYSHSDYSILSDGIKDVLSNSSKQLRMANNGCRVIDKSFSAVHAAKRLIEIADYSWLLQD